MESKTESMISGMVQRFEKGALTRRELIHGLAMLTAAGAASSPARAQDSDIRVVSVDHISVQVNDMQRSIEFYQRMFGLPMVSENRPEKIFRLGIGKTMVSLHDKAPKGLVDHFALAVENFDEARLTQALRARGANPQRNIDAGLHITDPDGIHVQVVAT